MILKEKPIVEYNKYKEQLRIIFRYFEFLHYISRYHKSYSISNMITHYCNSNAQLPYSFKSSMIDNLVTEGYLTSYKKDTYKGNKPTFVSKTQSGVIFFTQEKERFQKLKELIEEMHNSIGNICFVKNKKGKKLACHT